MSHHIFVLLEPELIFSILIFSSSPSLSLHTFFLSLSLLLCKLEERGIGFLLSHFLPSFSQAMPLYLTLALASHAAGFIVFKPWRLFELVGSFDVEAMEISRTQDHHLKSAGKTENRKISVLKE